MSLGLYLAIARVQISKHDQDLTSSTLLPIVGEVCTTSFIRLGEGERGRGGRGRVRVGYSNHVGKIMRNGHHFLQEEQQGTSSHSRIC